MTTIVSTRGRWYCAAVAYLLAVTALAATGLGCGDNESPVSDAAPEADTIEPEPDAGSEPELAITAISPQSAPLAGGIDITISGTGFVAEAGANTVVIGDRVSAEVTAMDSETLVARVPAGDAAGVVTVQVLNDNGSVSAADAFAYSAMPAITAITPDRADWRGGDLVTITGSGFAASAEPPVVRFGDSTADTVTVIDDSSLTAVAPQSADAFTIANVTVETASGTSAPAEFRYFGVGLLAAVVQRQIFDPTMYFIDTDTGAVQSLGPVVVDGTITSGLWGLLTTGDGIVYGITATTFGNGYPSTLAVVDPFARDGVVVAESIGAVNGNIFCNALTWFDGVAYCANRNQFLTLDLATAVTTSIGFDTSGSLNNGGGLAATADGTFFNIVRPDMAATTRQLYTVDIVTATRQLPAVEVDVVGRPVAMAVHNGELYVSAAQPPVGSPVVETDIVRLDPATGSVTLIKTVPGYVHALTHIGSATPL